MPHFLAYALLLGLVSSIPAWSAETTMHQEGCRKAVVAELFYEISPALFVESKLQGSSNARLYITVVHGAGLPGKPGQFIYCPDCSKLRKDDPVLICRGNVWQGFENSNGARASFVVSGFAAKPLGISAH